MGMSHVIPELLKKFEKANRKIIVYSPHHTRSFCYINDAIDQLYLLTINKNSLNKTYNIGNHKDEITIKKLSYLIKNYLKKKNVKIEFKSDEYNSPIRRCPSMREMNKLKKLRYINILDGISITYFWYKKNKLI
jgi:nucleoside-diphosphate-sugar epimerase